MIATVCDEGEFLQKVTRPAIQSFAREMPDADFCLVLINGSGRFDAAIRSWHPRLILKHYPLEIRKEFLRGYRFCYMTLPLHDLLCEYDEPLIYVDADTLLRGRLDAIYSLLERHDLVVRHYPLQELPGPTTARDAARVNNGLMALANNGVTREFTAELRRRVIAFLESGANPMCVTEPDGIMTGLDQELIWVICQEMSDRMSFLPLDPAFNDSQFMDASVLWHAKGNTRRNVRYRRAVAQILGHSFRSIALLPEYLLMCLFRYVRTLQWNSNLRRAFTISDLDTLAAQLSHRRRALIVNSHYLRFNPRLAQLFESIEVVDTIPDSYYLNRSRLGGRNRMELRPEAFSGETYDLVLSVNRVPGVGAELQIVHERNFDRDINWRTVRPFRGIRGRVHRLVHASGAVPVEPGTTAATEGA